jgi:GrpB-like predicted nucleotidyltransferase (UPF0157 family)
MSRSHPYPIIIEPYSPEWPRTFEIEKSRILKAIPTYMTQIEHVGSTAVPGLPAKPVIDILIGVRSLDDDAKFIPPLEKLGYIYIAELEKEIPERRYLQKVTATAHTHHLHITEADTQFFIDHIRFRDLLRLHLELVTEYAKLKYDLAKKYRTDREAYTDAKSDFIERVLRLP